MDHSSSSDPLPREEFGGLAAGQTLVTATRGITASGSSTSAPGREKQLAGSRGPCHRPEFLDVMAEGG